MRLTESLVQELVSSNRLVVRVHLNLVLLCIELPHELVIFVHYCIGQHVWVFESFPSDLLHYFTIDLECGQLAP